MGLQVEIIKRLSGFNLRVNLSSGQGIIGVLGASGAGKSMLLNCIAGLVDPDEGHIIVNGKIFFDSDKKINLPPRERTAGFLFQNYALFPHLTIAENIAFGLDNLSKSDKHKKAVELMERFNIEGMAKRYPSQISGGQQQRVALARALAVEPEILLLDEPFSALDNYLKNHLIKDMLGSLKDFNGVTLFVTHNMEEAYRLCDRIAVFNSGRVETFGLKEEIFQKPASLETAIITGCKNIAAAARKSNYTAEIPDWGITVSISSEIEINNGFVGIRANHILQTDGPGENCFPAWIADESQTPFRTSLYLKIGSEANNQDDYHIQWEISRDQRETIISMAQPFYIFLDPRRVFFVQD